MYCINCGKKINEGAKYCYYCGTKVNIDNDIKDIYEKAKDLVISTGKTSATYLSKELDIATDKVKEILEKLESDNVVTPIKGNRRFVVKGDTNEIKPVEEVKEKRKFNTKEILLLIMSYLGFLSLIPYLTEKEDEYIKFHAKEGVNLLAVKVIFEIIAGVLSDIKIKRSMVMLGSTVYKYVTPLYITIPIEAIEVILLVFSALGIYYALTSQKKTLPLMDKIRIIK